MKLHADTISTQFISSYGAGWLKVQQGGQIQTISHSLVVASNGEQLAWSVTKFEDLNAQHFEMLLACQPELVIFGSGEKLRFPAPALTQALMQARIGLESMDTQAACRTYNILASEGRRVVAALLV